jgi:hypothetical protein
MNVIQQLEILSSGDCDWNCDCDSLIAFCASHFHELPESSLNELGNLKVRLLNMIHSHQTLKLKTEHSLYEFLKTGFSAIQIIQFFLNSFDLRICQVNQFKIL